MNKNLKELRSRIDKSPKDPGIYRWLNEKGDILYIGKAKNLRNRLKSYVQKPDKSLGPWKLSLIEQVADFDVTIASNELEALVLETNLIKEHKPKYNVLMKDGKDYVYVRISLQEQYPSISVVRQIEKDGAQYFGPYVSAYDTRRILDALHCTYDYREEAKALERLNRDPTTGVNPSLAYQIGESCGVSIGKISHDEYVKRIDAVVHFFKGHIKDARRKAQELMKEAAQKKKFERAAKLRDAVQLIDRLQQKQSASDTSGENTDTIGLVIVNGKTQAVVLLERGGKIIDERNYSLKGQADSIEEALDQFLPQYYAGILEMPDAVILPKTYDGVGVFAAWLTERKGRKVHILVPERGKKAQLLELARKNAEEKLKSQEAKWEAAAKNIETALKELQNILKLPSTPRRIEAYDISHLGGTETVGSMVVSLNGKPNNKQYRSFAIQTLKEGDIDDYKALAEVLKRRLRYVVNEKEQFEEKGIIIRKALKNDQKKIEEISDLNQAAIGIDDINYKDYTVAKKDEEIIGFARLYKRSIDIWQLRSVWVDEKFRGMKIGQIIINTIIEKSKLPKMYLIVDPQEKLERYYEEIGFEIVKIPPPLLEGVTQKFCAEHPQAQLGTIMVYIASKHKIDASLSEKPDLLVIDGGKGQLNTVVKVLEEMTMEIPVIGLAKREEEVFLPNESLPIDFGKDSQAKYLLMRLRNEAHRFANNHREKRLTKKAIGSALDEIPGVGPKTRQELLNTFGNVDGVKNATDEELLTIVSNLQLEAMRKVL
jgi:excinuclease ABC subunit C